MSRHVWKSRGRALSRTYQRTDLVQGIHLRAGIPLLLGTVVLTAQTLAWLEMIPPLEFSRPV